MQSTAEQYRRIGNLILAVLEGSKSAREVLEDSAVWAGVSFGDKLVADAFHALQHFDHDEDIRQKDEEYAQAQRDGLKTYASRMLNPALFL